MSRRKAIIAVAVVALGLAAASIAEAGGGGRKGKPKPPAPAAPTRTVVNSTSRSWYTYVYSGTGPVATTIAEGNAQGAKVIAPGGSAVFNVKPNGDGNQFGDYIVIHAVPPLDVNNPDAPFGVGSWTEGNGNDAEYPVLQAGQAMTVTITQTDPTLPPEFNPPPP